MYTLVTTTHGIPEEDFASQETTSNLVHPHIVKGHPARAAIDGNVTGLDILPERFVCEVLVGGDWVQAPATALSICPEAKCRTKNTTLGWRTDILVPACVQHNRTAEEDQRWQKECEPETDVVCRVGHSDLAYQGTYVDEKIEIVIDSVDGSSWIDNDAFALFVCRHSHAFDRHLLGDERADVGLEATSTGAHDDETEHESCKCAIMTVEYSWCGRGDENDVANNGNTDGNDDSVLYRCQHGVTSSQHRLLTYLPKYVSAMYAPKRGTM